ncbi:MAG TPA: biopolymer transporter ExbD [Bacteroidales bacterium]|nr:biopolymer transporter ExbD [Bacteroidales bacterium]HPS45896.1 biopolymer transporter ExbD [Bacteroidales bacterium]HQI46646.1 biopolymer transporter ExbD [Bacteroidales bacterium]
MALKTRNKINTEFSMSSMSDLVFLLLIFFMLTSTLVSPNAIKILLPNSSSKTVATRTITIYINDQYQYFLEENPIDVAGIPTALNIKLAGQTEGTVVLKADKSVPLQYVVNVIDAVNGINEQNKTKHKVILATKPLKPTENE